MKEIIEILKILGIILSLFTGIGSLILGLITARKTEAERNKTTADAASIITDTNMKLLTTLNNKVDELEGELRKQQEGGRKRDAEIAKLNKDLFKSMAENIKLRKALCILIKQLKKCNIAPDWNEIDCLHLDVDTERLIKEE